MATHPDPGFGVAGSEPPLSYPLGDTALAEPAPEPDILDWLSRATAPATAVATLAAGDATERLNSAFATIAYLRDRNVRLIEDVAAARAEIAAARPSGLDR